MTEEQAKLFQIGDLVLITSCEEVRPVEEVKENGVYTTNVFSAITRLYRCHEIEQIPLTDEILEKNGFTKDVGSDCTYYYFPKISEIEKIWMSKTRLLKYDITDQFIFEGTPFIGVRTVDEFQRLLRLMEFVDFANNFKV